MTTPTEASCSSKSPVFHGTYGGFGTCRQPAGHEGQHTDYSRLWSTDLSDPLTIPIRERTPSA